MFEYVRNVFTEIENIVVTLKICKKNTWIVPIKHN